VTHRDRADPGDDAPMTRVAVLAAVLVSLLGAGAADAGAQATRDAASDEATTRAFALSHEIMSPYCPGMTLATCPSEAAAQLRTEIAGRFRAGESRAAIVDGLVGRFGDSIRGTPRPRGVALSLWVVPGLVGVAIIWALIRSARGATGGAQLVAEDHLPTAAPPALVSRLDAELEEMS
jgi:cytochrome c-type biogenesis protein CcmH/NrfF